MKFTAGFVGGIIVTSSVIAAGAAGFVGGFVFSESLRQPSNKYKTQKDINQ